MTRALVICRKEWQIWIDTPLGYVIATAFLITAGFFFSSKLFLVGQADMRGWFSALPLLLMFFMPALAMRMLADETRSGTFELLATMPLRTWDIVLGKFAAVILQLSVLLAITLVYPLSLSTLGSLDIGQILASYVALLLLAAAYGAVCLYASSLTRYEVVAYVLGFGMLLALFLVSQSMGLFQPALQNVIMMLSPLAHYQSMIRGVLMLEDIIYFVVMTSLFLTLTWFSLERRRWK